MPRQRNLLPLAGFLLCGIAFISYPLFFAQFPGTRDVPWANWLLFALGLGMVGVGLVRAFRSPERYRGRVAGPIFGVLSLAVLGFFAFMTMVMARQLPTGASAPKVGEKAPDFTPSGFPGQARAALQPSHGTGRGNSGVLGAPHLLSRLLVTVL